jgi:hypothetical protein
MLVPVVYNTLQRGESIFLGLILIILIGIDTLQKWAIRLWRVGFSSLHSAAYLHMWTHHCDDVTPDPEGFSYAGYDFMSL